MNRHWLLFLLFFFPFSDIFFLYCNKLFLHYIKKHLSMRSKTKLCEKSDTLERLCQIFLSILKHRIAYSRSLTKHLVMEIAIEVCIKFLVGLPMSIFKENLQVIFYVSTFIYSITSLLFCSTLFLHLEDYILFSSFSMKNFSRLFFMSIRELFFHFTKRILQRLE